MTVPGHLETYLGPSSRGWAPPDNRWGIQVSLFENTPELGVQTYATLGLSQHVLGLGSKQVRQKLVFSTWARYNADDVASFLMTLPSMPAPGPRASMPLSLCFGPIGFTCWKAQRRARFWSGCCPLTTPRLGSLRPKDGVVLRTNLKKRTVIFGILSRPSLA